MYSATVSKRVKLQRHHAASTEHGPKAYVSVLLIHEDGAPTTRVNSGATRSDTHPATLHSVYVRTPNPVLAARVNPLLPPPYHCTYMAREKINAHSPHEGNAEASPYTVKQCPYRSLQQSDLVHMTAQLSSAHKTASW